MSVLTSYFAAMFSTSSGTVRTVASRVEPLLRTGEVLDSFGPGFNASSARRKSARVLADDPFLLGFIEGATLAFVVAVEGNTSEKRALQTVGRVIISLFPGRAEGLDLINSAACANEKNPEYQDGWAKGAKVVAYELGADYSHDPEAREAIRVGRQMAEIGSEIAVHPGGERGCVISGMLWLYFTPRFGGVSEVLCKNGSCEG